MFAFVSVLLDTDATCFNDQVLGKWEIQMSKIDIIPENDHINCDDNFKTSQKKYITIIAPNVAIDEDGYYGTWTFAYT